ncbi:hypothetical protein [Actinacidiphila soli]|uniref:hypothetical protein n=1 Tax=Actinacidiphila soli TaxID=2487275 RepID=UPI000FCB2DC4|nr:hypothetical protein [Actinacidiphila soli]
MTQQLKSVVTLDHTEGMRNVPDVRYDRERSVYLRFARDPRDTGYLVQAWGDAFPYDGRGGYQGRLPHAPAVLAGAVQVLRTTWQEHVVEHQHTSLDARERKRTTYPFVDHWDVARNDPCPHWDDIMRRLARAGHTLFRTLFLSGDDGLREIAEHLLRALRRDEHVITVESDDLFVPWGMLYGPPDIPAEVPPGSAWRLDGFWGYRHVVEHGFSRGPYAFNSRIVVPDDTVTVGLNVDEKVDAEYPDTPYVKDVIEFFNDNAHAVVRRCKDDLYDALTSPEFADLITYFGCHGEVSGPGSAGQGEQPYLVLDGERIFGAELMGWLAGGVLPSQPLVFVGACQGGQLSSLFYPSFGRHLLSCGARSLLGPQVDLPRAFASDYTTRLFGQFLQRGAKLGDLVRTLARWYADEHRNPLGLNFSLYRGMDVHLWPDKTS